MVSTESELKSFILLSISNRQELLPNNKKLKKIFFYLVLGKFRHGSGFLNKNRLFIWANHLLEDDFKLFELIKTINEFSKKNKIQLSIKNYLNQNKLQRIIGFSATVLFATLDFANDKIIKTPVSERSVHERIIPNQTSSDAEVDALGITVDLDSQTNSQIILVKNPSKNPNLPRKASSPKSTGGSSSFANAFTQPNLPKKGGNINPSINPPAFRTPPKPANKGDQQARNVNKNNKDSSTSETKPVNNQNAKSGQKRSASSSNRRKNTKKLSGEVANANSFVKPGNDKGLPDNSNSNSCPDEFENHSIENKENKNSKPKITHGGQESKKVKKNKRRDSGELTKEEVKQSYNEFYRSMKEAGYDVTNLTEQRFYELARNTQTGKFDEKSLKETIGGLKAEVSKNIFTKLRRPENLKVDLDFQAELISSGKTVFIDHKQMEDFTVLAEKKSINVSNFPDHQTVAYNMGKKSMLQKKKFIGLENGPKSPNDTIHLVNFGGIQNLTEIPELIESFLKGAGQSEGILFI